MDLLETLTKKEGWLAKTGSNNKGWKDRYFILAEGKLNYFKNEKAESSLGVVDLGEVIEVKQSPARNGYGFDIKVPGRLYNFEAPTQALQEEWVMAINLSLDQACDLSTSSVTRRSSGTSRSSSIVSLGFGGRKRTRKGSSGQSSEPSLDHSVLPSLTPVQSKEKEDAVVHSLLEAEVDALRGKVRSLEGELTASLDTSSMLRQELGKSKLDHSEEESRLREQTTTLRNRITALEKSRTQLEAVNDSLRAQVQEKEDKVLVLQGEIKHLDDQLTYEQDEASSIQQKLEESEQLVASLQKEIVRKKNELTVAQASLKQERETFSKKCESEKIQRAKAEEQLRKMGEVWRKLEAAESERNSLRSRIKETQENKDKEMDKFRQQLTSMGGVVKERDGLQEQLQATRKELVDIQTRLKNTEVVKTEKEAVLKERDNLKEQLSALQRQKELWTVKQQASTGSDSVSEEELRWQLELENVKSKLEGELEAARVAHSKEKESLSSQVSELESQLAQSRKAEQDKEEEITRLKDRLKQLEKDIDVSKEKMASLQMEKEKATADLIAIRKASKERGRKASEEDTNVYALTSNNLDRVLAAPSPRFSPGPQQERLTVDHRLADAEKRAQLATRLLQEVQAERDSLKSQVSRLSPSCTPVRNGGINMPDGVGLSPVLLRNKTSATTALSFPDLPPPKPKRPPRELLNKYQS